MPIIQTRNFVRIVLPGNLAAAIEEVNSEVNTFLGTFPNLHDVLDVQTHTGTADKYSEKILYMRTVIYVEP